MPSPVVKLAGFAFDPTTFVDARINARIAQGGLGGGTGSFDPQAAFAVGPAGLYVPRAYAARVNDLLFISELGAPCDPAGPLLKDRYPTLASAQQAFPQAGITSANYLTRTCDVAAALNADADPELFERVVRVRGRLVVNEALDLKNLFLDRAGLRRGRDRPRLLDRRRGRDGVPGARADLDRAGAMTAAVSVNRFRGFSPSPETGELKTHGFSPHPRPRVEAAPAVVIGAADVVAAGGVRAPRHFGGAEAYGLCPLCRRPAKRLYHRAAGGPGCRRCVGFVYASQYPGAATTTARRCIAAMAELKHLSDAAPPAAWDAALLSAMTTAAAHARACALPLVRILARIERREGRRARRRVGGGRTPPAPTQAPALPGESVRSHPPGFDAALAAAWWDWTAASVKLHAVASALAEHGERLRFEDLVRVLHALGNACAPGLAFLADPNAEPRGGRWTVPASVLTGLSRSERRRPNSARRDAPCSTAPTAP